MSAVFRRRGLQELLALAGALLAAAAVVSTAPRQARAAEEFNIAVDQAQLMRVPPRTSTIVIGNPLIADVSLQSGGILVVTGKGYGSTNFLALDRAGNVLTERMLIVRAPSDNIVTIYAGMERGTWSCEPTCQPRIMLGDSQNFFNPTLAQTGTRNGTASTGGGPAAIASQPR
jgi:hypothetical protein